MKNKLINYITIGLCLFAMFFIITNNKLINDNIINAINLWITKVFPSLFPMFIINEILIYTGFPAIITRSLSKITNKLKINSYAIYVFIMSIFSGAPSNAIILKTLAKNNEINSKDTSYILAFTFFSNPLFLYAMLNNIFTTNITIKIIFINYISNIIIYIFFHKKISANLNNIAINKINIKTTSIISNSIKKSLDTLIMILGTITFYIIISSILINCFNLNSNITTIIKGCLEITQGLHSLTNLTINTNIKEIIAIAIISFGGLSIHSQINNIISDTNIEYKYFFIGRILHVIISMTLTIII